MVVAYHACDLAFADALRRNELSVTDWRPSRNDYDWLGHGIYFWEGSLRRAEQWAAQQRKAVIVEADIDLGDCFDPTSYQYPELLRVVYAAATAVYQAQGWDLPTNTGLDGKLRKLDCLIINEFVRLMENRGIRYQTIRCPFEEGEPIFPGSMIRTQTHIQICVRDSSCISIRDFHSIPS